MRKELLRSILAMFISLSMIFGCCPSSVLGAEMAKESIESVVKETTITADESDVEDSDEREEVVDEKEAIEEEELKSSDEIVKESFALDENEKIEEDDSEETEKSEVADEIEKIEYANTGSDQNEAVVFKVGSVEAKPGDTVEVNVSVENNVGILGTDFQVEYDEGLTLLNAESNSSWAFGYMTFQKPGRYTSPCKFSWDAQDVSEIKNGKILSLSFKVSDSATVNQKFGIRIISDNNSTFDADMLPVATKVENGYISISSVKSGDVNDDGNINTLDVILTRRHIVGGYDIEINRAAADVNGDSNINTLDVIVLRRYIVGGYGIDSLPTNRVTTTPVDSCNHKMTKYVANEANCTKAGNIEYWHCSECDKYYKDENGRQQITIEDTVVPAKGHVEVIDPAVDATATTPGKTEGSHCSVCKMVLIEQKTVASNYYRIKYVIANGDDYIASKNIELDTRDFPVSIAAGASIYLDDIEVDGYQFLGWFDASDGGSPVKEITNANHNYTLYAHWKSLEYTIQFKSDLVTAESIKYSTSEGKVLPVLKLDGYTFVGWSDSTGNIVKHITPGTTGNIVLVANWISDRNQAWSKNKYDDPIVYENDDVILFAYEIGTVNNVPIDVIEDFGKINQSGVPMEVEKTYSSTTSESCMDEYIKAIESATTDTSSWTLSKDWSESTSVTEEYCNRVGITRQEAETTGKTESGEWYVTNSKGGNETTSTVDTIGFSSLRSETKNSTKSIEFGGSLEHDNTNTHEKQTSWDISAKLGFGKQTSNENSTETSLGFEGEGLKAGLNTGITSAILRSINFDIGGKYGQTTTDTNSITNKFGLTGSIGATKSEGSSSQTGVELNHSASSASTSTWNSESGYKNSATTSNSVSVSNGLAEEISKSTGYGSTYINSGGESNTQGLSHSSSSSDSYSNSVTWSKVKSEETKVKYSTSSTKTGFHRWVTASTAHVFGVVGYDIATKEYFTYTYSVMDDERHRFEDYSYNSAKYDDNQNGVIEFNIPNAITDYVAAKTFATEGLIVDLDGTVTGYEGSDSYVVVPDYAIVNNHDNGRSTVIKITKIAPDAFRGNENITAIELSNYITDIPDNAFKGCIKLSFVKALGMKKVGNNAFENTPLLNEWVIQSEVDTLGENSFDGANTLNVYARNENVVKAAINSGAKNIKIDLQFFDGKLDNTILSIPSSVSNFELNGYDKTYNNLIIKSNAERTKINRINITSNGETPLQIDSDKVELYQVNIENAGYAAILGLTKNNINLDIYGTVKLNGQGTTSVLCKRADIVRTKTGLTTKISTNGTWICCEIPSGSTYVNFTGEGGYKTVSESDFDNMCKSHRLIFNAGDGTCSESSRTLSFGSKYGQLPRATRDYYTFEGWYTESGDVVTDSTIMGEVDVTLYARWSKNAISDWVLASSVPEGAEIVDTKWKYSEKEWITSTSSSVSGYTLDSSKTETNKKTETYWGDPSSWTKTKRTTGDTVRLYDQKVEREKTGTTPGTYHMVSYCYQKSDGSAIRCYRDGKVSSYSSYGYASSYGVHPRETDISASEFNSLTRVNPGSYMGSKYKYNGKNDCSKTGYILNYGGSDFIFFENGITNNDVYSNVYYYRYQDLMSKTVTTYTYHLYKNIEKESLDEVSAGENISNVRKYVKYRAKSDAVTDGKIYHMVSYCYQKNDESAERCYRNSKVTDYLSYGYSSVYGVNERLKDISADEFDSLTRVDPKAYMGSGYKYNGKNDCSKKGYILSYGDYEYIFFVSNVSD